MFYMSFLNFSKEVASDLTLSEKLKSILTTGVGGYILVFSVLALIWFILAILGKFFDRKANKVTLQVTPPVTPAPAPETVASVSDDGEIVAAIVAAISAYSGKPASGFRVVSFRKKH